jgi:hypothetical protein
MGTTLSYLTTLFGTSTSTTGPTSLLATLYGQAGQSTNSLGQNPVTALQAAQKNQTRDVKTTALQPAVRRAVNAFTAAVSSAKTVKQLLANPAVMQVLLTANGLADQIPYTALVQKTLQSNANDTTSLVNKLADTRWKPAVQTYDFANKGLSVIQDPKVISTLANAYAEVTWRHSLDATTPGLSNALTFRSEASTITSVDQILGDPVMRKVVTTALDPIADRLPAAPDAGKGHHHAARHQEVQGSEVRRQLRAALSDSRKRQCDRHKQYDTGPILACRTGQGSHRLI